MDLKEDKNADFIKTCDDCKTSKTPLWRGGPGGPKSLCNACGIKYHKRRRQAMGFEIGRSKATKKKRSKSVNRSSEEVKEILKTRLVSLGSEIVLQRSSKLMSRLREEEQAAVLLMALSCGSVYA